MATIAGPEFGPPLLCYRDRAISTAPIWLHRGQFYWQRQDEHDRPLCRIGDVIDLAERSQRPRVG